MRIAGASTATLAVPGLIGCDKSGASVAPDTSEAPGTSEAPDTSETLDGRSMQSCNEGIDILIKDGFVTPGCGSSPILLKRGAEAVIRNDMPTDQKLNFTYMDVATGSVWLKARETRLEFLDFYANKVTTSDAAAVEAPTGHTGTTVKQMSETGGPCGIACNYGNPETTHWLTTNVLAQTLTLRKEKDDSNFNYGFRVYICDDGHFVFESLDKDKRWKTWGVPSTLVLQYTTSLQDTLLLTPVLVEGGFKLKTGQSYVTFAMPDGIQLKTDEGSALVFQFVKVPFTSA